MQKPIEKTKRYYDYNDCAEYIAHKLGVKDLRDFAGKYDTYNPDVEIPYHDFWAYIIDKFNISNGSFIQFYEEYAVEAKDWESKIIKAFIEEFGIDAQYYVYW